MTAENDLGFPIACPTCGLVHEGKAGQELRDKLSPPLTSNLESMLRNPLEQPYKARELCAMAADEIKRMRSYTSGCCCKISTGDDGDERIDQWCDLHRRLMEERQPSETNGARFKVGDVVGIPRRNDIPERGIVSEVHVKYWYRVERESGGMPYHGDEPYLVSLPAEKSSGCMACGGKGYIDDPSNPCDCAAKTASEACGACGLLPMEHHPADPCFPGKASERKSWQDREPPHCPSCDCSEETASELHEAQTLVAAALSGQPNKLPDEWMERAIELVTRRRQEKTPCCEASQTVEPIGEFHDMDCGHCEHGLPRKFCTAMHSSKFAATESGPPGSWICGTCDDFNFPDDDICAHCGDGTKPSPRT